MIVSLTKWNSPQLSDMLCSSLTSLHVFEGISLKRQEDLKALCLTWGGFCLALKSEADMFPVVLSRTNTRMHLAEVYTGDGGEPVLDRERQGNSYFALYGWLGLYFPNSQNTKYGKK